MGIYSFTQAGGAAVGFVVGGVLTDAVGWPAIFLVNVPIGVASGCSAAVCCPARPARASPPASTCPARS